MHTDIRLIMTAQREHGLAMATLEGRLLAVESNQVAFADTATRIACKITQAPCTSCGACDNIDSGLEKLEATIKKVAVGR